MAVALLSMKLAQWKHVLHARVADLAAVVVVATAAVLAAVDMVVAAQAVAVVMAAAAVDAQAAAVATAAFAALMAAAAAQAAAAVVVDAAVINFLQALSASAESASKGFKTQVLKPFCIVWQQKPGLHATIFIANCFDRCAQASIAGGLRGFRARPVRALSNTALGNTRSSLAITPICHGITR